MLHVSLKKYFCIVVVGWGMFIPLEAMQASATEPSDEEVSYRNQHSNESFLEWFTRLIADPRTSPTEKAQLEYMKILEALATQGGVYASTKEEGVYFRISEEGTIEDILFTSFKDTDRHA